MAGLRPIGRLPISLDTGRSRHYSITRVARTKGSLPLPMGRVSASVSIKARSNATGQPLFPNARGSRLSAHGVHYLLAKHVTRAAEVCPSLKHKRVSPHVLRHTTAMDLLQEGNEQAVIALCTADYVRRPVSIHVRAERSDRT